MCGLGVKGGAWIKHRNIKTEIEREPQTEKRERQERGRTLTPTRKRNETLNPKPTHKSNETCPRPDANANLSRSKRKPDCSPLNGP